MTTREISELRRRMRPDRTNITAVRGCYVSGSGEILSDFQRSVALMSEEDKEKYLSVFRKVLSGTQDKNLLDLPFTTAQVADSEEHRLLMRLRSSALGDEDAVQSFFRAVIQSFRTEDHYLILLAHENYDVPARAKDGAALDSSEVFSYILCAVCPVRPGKEALRYVAEEKEFHNCSAGFTADAPEVGFLFPSFDGRRANIYDCLYYTRSSRENHPELTQALFKIEPPLPADQQKQTFGGVLHDALEEECSLSVVQNLQQELCERIEAHQELKSDEPLVVSREDVRAVLESSGVSEEKLSRFCVDFEGSFGADALLSPRNLTQPRSRLTTADVVITVAPGKGELIQTRTLGGVKYILIRADEGVELNGVDIEIAET